MERRVRKKSNPDNFIKCLEYLWRHAEYGAKVGEGRKRGNVIERRKLVEIEEGGKFFSSSFL